MCLKKIEDALRPNLKKCLVFLVIILFFMSVWVNVLINILPVMVIGTQEFYDVFCEYKRLADNTAMSDTEREAAKARLDAILDGLNEKYSAFSKFNSDLFVANMLVPSSLYTCVLDKATLDVIGTNIIENNIIGIDFHCNPYSIFALFRNLVFIYIFSCFIVWLFEYKRNKKVSRRKKR